MIRQPRNSELSPLAFVAREFVVAFLFIYFRRHGFLSGRPFSAHTCGIAPYWVFSTEKREQNFFGLSALRLAPPVPSGRARCLADGAPGPPGQVPCAAAATAHGSLDWAILGAGTARHRGSTGPLRCGVLYS